MLRTFFNASARPTLLVAGLALLAGCPRPSSEGDGAPAPAPVQQAPVAGLAAEPPVQPPIDPVVSCNTTGPDTPVTPALLTTGLPCEPELRPPFDSLPNLQHGFDYYSWLTFIALNAPAPGVAPPSGPQQPTLWQAWAEVSDLILDGGSTPAAWGSPRVIPAACQGVASSPGARLMHRAGISKTLASEVVEPFDTGPLIDQAGNYVRYEILVNQPMYEYIVRNGLYSRAGQAGFSGDAVFPSGSNAGNGNGSAAGTGTVGAIMLKAAWKVIGPGDDASRFHTVQALAYNPPSQSPHVEESCTAVTVGLVGWHAAHKTAGSPQWVWSTFEHQDNVPEAADVAAGRLGTHYNFYRPGCSTTDCPVNQPPPRPWDPNRQPFPGGFTSQITRVVPLTDATRALNEAFQGILEGTVWANYMLVSTQWPTDLSCAKDPASPACRNDPLGNPAPVYLANTTLETYIQGEVPQSSSSCMGCHGNATDTRGRPSDFTFILERAQ